MEEDILKGTKLDKLAAFLREDEQQTFTFQEAQAWSDELGWSSIRPSLVIQGLKERGFIMTERPTFKKVAGFKRNDNADRWTVCPSHGGGGGSSIDGMAGREG